MPVKFIIVGCGHIGKRHMAMIAKNPEADLVAICDTKPLKDLGISDILIPYFSSFSNLMEAKIQADVVIISTPNGFHAEQCIGALKNNYNVVCEKPLAINNNDALEIKKWTNITQKHFFCVMQNRYSPPSKWLKEIVSNKVIGKPYMLQVNCYWNRDDRYYIPNSWRGTTELDGGTLFTQFSHFVDMIYWIMGDIIDVKAQFEDFNHQKTTDFEDSGNIIFRFKNNAIGSFSYSTSLWQENLESSLTLIGEKGAVKIGGQYMNEVTYCNIEGYKMPKLDETNPPNDYGQYKGSAANHYYVIKNVIDTINGKAKPDTPIEEGVKVVEIINKIYSQKL